MVGELSRRPRQDPSIDRSMFARGIRIALGATTEIISMRAFAPQALKASSAGRSPLWRHAERK
jgi:hypothetical protein